MKTHHLIYSNQSGWKRSSTVILKVLLAFMLFLNVEYSAAQLAILDVSITIPATSNSTEIGYCHLTISDTSDCNSVAIELSDGITDSLILFREFEYDVTNGLPPLMSWSRIGNTIEIGLGNLQNQITWKARVRLRDASNNWGAWEEFIFN